MVARGITAVVFERTVEFRAIQLDVFDRGNPDDVEAALAAAREARAPAFAILADYVPGRDLTAFQDTARTAYDRFGDHLAKRTLSVEARNDLRMRARELRDAFVTAATTTDRAEAEAGLQTVLDGLADPVFQDTPLQRLADQARTYRARLPRIDLEERARLAEPLQEVLAASHRLFGPLPGDEPPRLIMNRYGATRMDMARRALDDLLYDEAWVQVEPGQPLVLRKVPRAEQFAGTALEPYFGLVGRDLDTMLRPAWTVYWQYVLDDSTEGYYFGGVGAEILGTLSLTVLAILFAFPLGVIAAAYLVEVAGDNLVVRFLRMCINTLAGVPSIVFGLFGLAFFVLVIVRRPCVLTASLTLAVLILPIIIRASEEAIRAVPPAYKEAALALGASRLRCFLTVQLPAALPGILTGVILSMSRAAGETAPVLFTGVVALGPRLDLWRWPPWQWLFEATRTLSYGSYDIAVADRLAKMVPHQQYGMVTTLVAIVLLLNIVAIALRWRISRRLRGQ